VNGFKKKKKTHDESIDKYKATLIARGFIQGPIMDIH
jgi:hypothetical protein